MLSNIKKYFKKAQYIKIRIRLQRNETCLCGSNKKYKNCCQPKGIIFTQTIKK